MSYLEMAKRARVELRNKRNNEETPDQQAPSFVSSFISSPPYYAHPWPDCLPDLGPRRVVAFTRCLDCTSDPPADVLTRYGPVPGDRGTWCAYGDRPLCLRHARPKAGR